ncbi:hypothetical protein ACFFMN_23725 [Planobispora siamensis]|uniref:Uncharacterized protein n=1 Tax=Planobispora siamensis TaxID=936338 RepID=A0A8J3SM37_9ACTN|nr:hypothetical protein [Planobispora siamensis]GIH95367.1 hypothetical protein Psi01_59970 [Planobispora siamensis]
MLWFGPPWPPEICYDDGERLAVDRRTSVPAGTLCADCDTPIGDGDRGVVMPHLVGLPPPGGAVTTRAAYIHIECQMLSVVGPLAHVQGCCPGTGLCQRPQLPRRQEALEVWAWMTRRGA